jgi:hypothetical protein
VFKLADKMLAARICGSQPQSRNSLMPARPARSVSFSLAAYDN